ncbi:unnamed protein product [Diamesa serratosioi]
MSVPLMGQQQPSPQMLQNMNLPQMNVPPQQNQVANQQQTVQQKDDNLSKAKNLIQPLRESLASIFRSAAQLLQHNNMTDVGTIKAVDNNLPRFDKHLEEFYSICDQIELHLVTSKKCLQQANASLQSLPLPVASNRTDYIGIEDNTLSYPQYLELIRIQINCAKEIHDTLVMAAQNISPSD